MDALDVAREGYAAFNRGDIAWIVDHLSPDIVWEDAKEVPGSAVRVGVDQVERYLQSLHREWDEIRFEPERISPAGDDVLAWARVIARGRASGVEVDAPVAHLFEIRGDRCCRVRTFFDRAEADASARRAPQDSGS